MPTYNLHDPDFDQPVAEPISIADAHSTSTASPAPSFLGGLNAKAAFYLGLGSGLALCSAAGFFTLLYLFFTQS